MTEIPITCTAEEVRGLLDGTLTELVRELEPQPELQPRGYWQWKGVFWWVYSDLAAEYSPFGNPGQVLWVREEWAKAVRCGIRQVAFSADGRWGSPDANGIILWHGWVAGVTDKAISGSEELRGHWVGRPYFRKWQPAETMTKLISRLRLTHRQTRVEQRDGKWVFVGEVEVVN